MTADEWRAADKAGQLIVGHEHVIKLTEDGVFLEPERLTHAEAMLLRDKLCEWYPYPPAVVDADSGGACAVTSAMVTHLPEEVEYMSVFVIDGVSVPASHFGR